MLARDFPFLDRRFVAMAHRGGWVAPEEASRENTLHAFRGAVALGYRYIETDVRTTWDGEVVLMHDAELDRVTDTQGAVANLTLAVVSRARVAGLDPVPRFSDVLEEFPGVRFNIDLKDDRSVEAVASLLRRQSCAGRVCVSSFSGARMRAFRRLAPDVATGVGPLGVAWAGFAPLLRRLRIDAGVVLQVPARIAGDMVPLVRADLIRFAHATGRLVHVWTVDEPTEMERLLELGVDGLISNNLIALKRVLTAHGLWENAA